MKRILLYILFIAGSTSIARAQNPDTEDADKKQRNVEAYYVAFVTQKLNLTEAEAQKFWPVHSQFQAEIKSVDLNLPELERQQAMLNVKKRYQDRFTAILGGNRSNTFYRLHGEFITRLIEIRKKRQQNMNQRPPGRRRGN